LSTPTIDGDKVYTLSKMGDLFCLEAATGKVVWSKQLNKDMGFELPTWHFASSALIIGDRLFLNIGSAGLALNKNTGDLIWSNGKGKCGYATPVAYTIGGQKGLALFGEVTLFGVSQTDGKKQWEFPWKTRYEVNAADPIVVDNKVFISSGYNRGCALIEISGGAVNKLWENKSMRNHMNCCVLSDGFLYGFDDGSLACLKFADGSEQWSERSLGKGALMMSADGRLICMSDKGELVIVKTDPQQFTAIARAQILPKARCWTTPTLANGRIYARNAPGDFVCVDVSGK
jgi:outer membrane protein assembly factor BamB